MKKNKMMRLASGLLVAVLLTTCMISGTFAKYTTTVSGTDTARVAKFEVSSDVNTAIVNIFDDSAIYDLKDANFADPADDTDVVDAADGENGIIAPGTWGKCTFVISNKKSEVTLTYDVTYTADEKEVPLQWSLDGSNWKDNIADLSVAGQALAVDTDVNVTLYWKWAFDGVDADDTELGEAGTAAPTATIDVTFTQVD